MTPKYLSISVSCTYNLLPVASSSSFPYMYRHHLTPLHESRNWFSSTVSQIIAIERRASPEPDTADKPFQTYREQGKDLHFLQRADCLKPSLERGSKVRWWT